jgi:hypothetical protein
MEHFDLDAAVRAGVIRSDQADALRRFDEQRREAPAATEERFALVSGFADVMAAIGILMVTVTSIFMIGSILPPACLLLPLPCWWAATYFTERRRMMLSSFVIFGAFALTSVMATLAIGLLAVGSSPLTAHYGDVPGAVLLLTSAVACVASYAHWRRFRLPFAFASFAVALVNVGVNALHTLVPDMPNLGVDVIAGLPGPILFGWAMWWDISDVRRETIRSDVAFWLHLAAGFQIVKSGMALILGTSPIGSGWGRAFYEVADPTRAEAVGVLVLFLAFALIALVIDRRSLLTSGMIYAVPALGLIVGDGGHSLFGPGLFVAGLGLTFLAVRWSAMRERLLGFLPDRLVAQLPRPQLKAVGPRPVY